MTYEDRFDVLLKSDGLSTRAANSLLNAVSHARGSTTYDDLLAFLREDDLRGITNLGKISRREVIAWANARGIETMASRTMTRAVFTGRGEVRWVLLQWQHKNTDPSRDEWHDEAGARDAFDEACADPTVERAALCMEVRVEAASHIKTARAR